MEAVMVADIAIPSSAQGHLRRIDMRHDLEKVADLVEMCFFDTLDPDGKQYLKEMRRAAQNTTILRWAGSVIEEGPMPPSGFVWEEDDVLVGNLSLIPIQVQGARGYMIANVATHPSYRDRGIARALTGAALSYARNRNAASTWLQVRDDNPAAIHIYATSGFKERFRRTSWYNGPEPERRPDKPGIRIGKRTYDDWLKQRDWLRCIYPLEMEWHMPLDWNLFRMDVWGKFYRFFNLEYPRHWSVEHHGDLKGVISWNHTSGYSDPLWLAVPEEIDEDAIFALLIKLRNSIRPGQPVNLNLPAGMASEVLHKAGFYTNQTLIWMEHKFLP